MTAGIVCPACGATARVHSTRQRPGKTVRVHVCKACGRRFRSEQVITVKNSPGREK